MKTKIFVALVSVLFLAQLYLLYTTTWWGPETRFPMTLLLRPWNALVPGALALFGILSSKPGTQRNILYSIIAASAIQLITIEIMLWLRQSALVIVVLLSTDFIAFQYLQYFAHLNYASKKSSNSAETKGSASISGILLRLTLIGAASLLVLYFMVGSEAFTEFGLTTVAVLLLPIAIMVIVQSRRTIRNSDTPTP